MSERRDPRGHDGGDAPVLDPETLAALMEGRLSDEDRARALEVLARSDADLELLADAAVANAALDETETVTLPTTGASPASPRFPTRRWLALAAILIGLITIPFVLRGPGAGRDASDGLLPLRTALVDLPVFTPTDLPATVGGEAFRSAAGGEILDSLSASARSFRRGALWAQLTVLEPAARTGSRPDVALRPLLLGSGARAQTLIDAWVPANDAESWLEASRALAAVESDAAFRLGMAAERISLALARDPPSSPNDAATREAFTSAFDDLPATAQDRLAVPYETVLTSLASDPPDPTTLEQAVRALGRAVMELPPDAVP